MRTVLLTLLLTVCPLLQGGWSAIYKLQLNGTGQTNFPVALSSANNSQIAAILSKFATTGNGGLVTSGTGADIWITSDAACTTPVSFERAIWTTNPAVSPGYVQFFFQATTNGTDYLCLGNPAATDQSTTATWSASYQRVWHTPNGSTLTSPSPESTSNADNAVLHATPTATTSPLGGAAVFNGSSQYLSFTGVTFAQPFTVMAWINTTSIASDTSFIGGANGSLGFRVDNTGHPYVTRTNAADDSRATTAISANTWVRVAMTQDSTAHCIYYINGVAASPLYASCQTAFAANTTTVGAGFSATRFFPGAMSEIYFLSANEVANWFADDYNSQKPSSTFITVTALATGVCSLAALGAGTC